MSVKSCLELGLPETLLPESVAYGRVPVPRYVPDHVSAPLALSISGERRLMLVPFDAVLKSSHHTGAALVFAGKPVPVNVSTPDDNEAPSDALDIVPLTADVSLDNRLFCECCNLYQYAPLASPVSLYDDVAAEITAIWAYVPLSVVLRYTSVSAVAVPFVHDNPLVVPDGVTDSPDGAVNAGTAS